MASSDHSIFKSVVSTLGPRSSQMTSVQSLPSSVKFAASVQRLLIMPSQALLHESSPLYLIPQLSGVDLKFAETYFEQDPVNRTQLQQFRKVLSQLPPNKIFEILQQLTLYAAHTALHTAQNSVSRHQAQYYSERVKSGDVQPNEMRTEEFMPRLIMNRIKLLLGFQESAYLHAFAPSYKVPAEFGKALQNNFQNLENKSWIGLYYQASSLIRMSGALLDKWKIQYQPYCIQSNGKVETRLPVDLKKYASQSTVVMSDSHLLLQLNEATSPLARIPADILKTMTFIHAGDLDYETHYSPWMNQIEKNLNESGLSLEQKNIDLSQKKHMDALIKAMHLKSGGHAYPMPLLSELIKLREISKGVGQSFYVAGNHDSLFEKLGDKNLGHLMEKFNFQLLTENSAVISSRTLYVGCPITPSKIINPEQVTLSANGSYQRPAQMAEVEVLSWINGHVAQAAANAVKSKKIDELCVIMHCSSGKMNGQIDYLDALQAVAQKNRVKLKHISGHDHQNVGVITINYQYLQNAQTINVSIANRINNLNQNKMPFVLMK